MYIARSVNKEIVACFLYFSNRVNSKMDDDFFQNGGRESKTMTNFKIMIQVCEDVWSKKKIVVNWESKHLKEKSILFKKLIVINFGTSFSFSVICLVRKKLTFFSNAYIFAKKCCNKVNEKAFWRKNSKLTRTCHLITIRRSFHAVKRC